MRMLSAEHLRLGRDALLRGTSLLQRGSSAARGRRSNKKKKKKKEKGTGSVEQWMKLGDDIAVEMLVPEDDLYGKVFRAQGRRDPVFEHICFFHLFVFNPHEVERAFSSASGSDDGCTCTSESISIKFPAHGLCSLHLELEVMEDGVLFIMESRSASSSATEAEVIDVRHEVIAICPTAPDWDILDKYSYENLNLPEFDNNFLLHHHRDMYPKVVRALKDGLPLPLLVSVAVPILPEHEARVMRMFM